MQYMLHAYTIIRHTFENGEHVSMLQNVLQHTYTSNTELLISKTRNQSIVYHFSHCIDSNLLNPNLLTKKSELVNTCRH